MYENYERADRIVEELLAKQCGVPTKAEQLAIEHKYAAPEAMLVDVMILLSYLAPREDGQFSPPPATIQYLSVAIYTFLSDLLDAPNGPVDPRVISRTVAIATGHLGDYRY